LYWSSARSKVGWDKGFGRGTNRLLLAQQAQTADNLAAAAVDHDGDQSGQGDMELLANLAMLSTN
jgi:hypothetical protein